MADIQVKGTGYSLYGWLYYCCPKSKRIARQAQL